MDIKSEKTVWMNVESNRYFIIPNDKDLLEGSFELKTVDRKERFVQEVDVSNYELTEEEAHEWMQEQVMKQVDLAKEAVKNAFTERKKDVSTDADLLLEETLPPNLVTEAQESTPLTMVTDNNGTFDSFDSFVESNDQLDTTQSIESDLQLPTPPSPSSPVPVPALSTIPSSDSTSPTAASPAPPRPAISAQAAFGDKEFDYAVKEAVSILNRAVSDIQLTAARAAADLQDLKEKLASQSNGV